MLCTFDTLAYAAIYDPTDLTTKYSGILTIIDVSERFLAAFTAGNIEIVISKSVVILDCTGS